MRPARSPPPRSAARGRWNGSPTARDALARPLDSWRHSLRLHHCHEEIGEARFADFAQRCQLLTIGIFNQQNAFPEQLTLMDWPQGARGSEALRTDHDLEIARLELLHARTEDNAAAIDEHHVTEHVLDLFDLMRGHQNGAALIEVIVQQRIVELLAVGYIETTARLVQHQQPGIDGH